MKRAGWQAVERALRVRQPPLADVTEALRDAGLWSEAMALDSDGLLEWAASAVIEKRVMTAADACYPLHWMSRLGAVAPPALWVEGEMPPGPYVSIVGGRAVPSSSLKFAAACGSVASAAGFSVASGGAKGCDLAAMRGVLECGGAGIEILPFGFGVSGGFGRMTMKRRGENVCRLSACAPDEEFTTGSAMERNALIYAIGEAAVIAHARFKEGGTWHGAVEAQRRRLTTLIVREDCKSAAHRALVSLGALPLRKAEDLSEILKVESGCRGEEREAYDRLGA